MSQPGEDDDRDGEGSGEENPPKAACKRKTSLKQSCILESSNFTVDTWTALSAASLSPTCQSRDDSTSR